MKLIVIYGPPAIGKLTVANELSKITNMNVVHNHLTADLLEPLLSFGEGNFFKHLFKLRREILKVAIKEDINIILTTCYVKKLYNSNMKSFISLVNKNKGKIYFIHLKCDERELFKRVKNESRKKFGKLKSVKKLKSNLKKLDFTSPIPFVDSYTIDNTKLSPKKVAQLIKKHFKLK